MKYKTYPKMKDSGMKWIDQIPEGWNIKKGRFFITIHGSSDKELIEDENGVSYFKVDNLNFTSQNLMLENSSTNVLSKHKPIPEFTILIPKRGEAINTNKVTICQTKCYIDSNIMGLEIVKDYDTKFFAYFLLARTLGDLADKTTIPQINNKHIKPLFFPIPQSTDEQKKIAKFLDKEIAKMDFQIQKNQKLIKLLQEKKQSVINHAITKGLDDTVLMKDSGIEWIGEIPSDWVMNKLQYLSEKIGDGIHSTPNYVDISDYYFINGNNLDGKIVFSKNTNNVSKNEFEKYKLNLNTSTVLLSINGTIGNVSLYDDEKIILGKSACYINCKKDLDRKFLAYFLESSNNKNFYNLEKTGTTIFNLSLHSIKKIPIPNPKLLEQKQIVTYLDEKTKKADSLISKVESQIQKLQEFRKSLISSAVTGKICVTN